MSYEGYEQHICKNGHRFDNADVWSFDPAICPYCKVVSAFCNSVDQTNGEELGFITDESFNTLLVSPKKMETCGCCGHTEIVEQAVYRIPTKAEMYKHRTIFVADANGDCQRMTLEEYDSQEE